jgi:light-regulated signal transduction histidine kinase (bacteriophytochrome)
MRLNEDLERFAFVASHDLREPLRMITVYTQLLQRRILSDAGPEAKELAGNIITGARRMRELIDDLRAYAELGAPAELSSSVDLNVVAQKAVSNLALSIQTSGAAVTWDALPSISGYEGHLVPLFQNLIGNALKYRRAEAPRIHIGYSAGEQLQFSVTDNGMGIAPQFHETIFVAFRRLHGTEIPGSGLGLAICKRVVERYGGTIWVESRPGEGSTFRFTLPATLLAMRPAERATLT